MNELTVNELIGKRPQIDNKYNQELWEKICLECDLYQDKEEPFSYMIEDCLKLQLIIFLEWGIFSTSKQVYEIWCRYSGWMSANWLIIDYKYAIEIFKNFMDNSTNTDFLN